MFRLCKLAVLAAFFFSCSLVTFEELSTDTNIPGQYQYFNGEYYCIDFSIQPDHASVESQLTLQRENQTVSYSAIWDSKKLYIKEDPSWKKGKQYKVTLDGNLLMNDGRYYKYSLSEIFYYGERNNNLTVVSYTPSFDSIIAENERLHIEFNKPINISSFQENFTLSPYSTTAMIFSPDKKTVDIQAADGWGINTTYTWRIPELLADDDYSLEAPIDGRFTTNIDTELPQIEKICPVDVIGPGVYNFLSPGIDKKLQQGGALLGIVFTKPMDRFSVESAVSITPAVKGYLQQDPVNPKQFLYIPEEFYDVGVRYKLTIAASTRDTSGLSLQSERTEFFEPQNGYLELLTLTAKSESGTNTTTVTNFSDTDTIHDFTVDSSTPYSVKFTLQFSTALGPSEIANIVSKVKLEVHFPSTTSPYSLVSVDWDELVPDTMTIEYQNSTLLFPVSGFNVYALKITGGTNGVADGRGGYLKEDICVYFNMLQ